MTVGRSHAAAANSRVGRIYRRLFGIEDFHSHFRWHAIRDLIEDTPSTLEVGANSGLMAFEIAAAYPSMRIVASEFDPDLVSTARQIARVTPFPNVEVVQEDLRKLSDRGGFDQLLAIDVLEHINDDHQALAEIHKALRPKGTLVISVPTPAYPRYFGRTFADSIGHVRDGYDLNMLTTMLSEAGFKVERIRPYGFSFMSRCCSVVYMHERGPRTTVILSTLLRPLALLGEIIQGSLPATRMYTSIALRARRNDPAS